MEEIFWRPLPPSPSISNYTHGDLAAGQAPGSAQGETTCFFRFESLLGRPKICMQVMQEGPWASVKSRRLPNQVRRKERLLRSDMSAVETEQGLAADCLLTPRCPDSEFPRSQRAPSLVPHPNFPFPGNTAFPLSLHAQPQNEGSKPLCHVVFSPL